MHGRSRVIFATDLQPELFATEQGRSLRTRLKFVGESSVRHDNHYHVDFNNPNEKNGQQDGADQPAAASESKAE